MRVKMKSEAQTGEVEMEGDEGELKNKTATGEVGMEGIMGESEKCDCD